MVRQCGGEVRATRHHNTQQQGVQAWDRYAYTNNSPTTFVDPTGNTTNLPCIFCDQTWGDYSSTSGLGNKIIDVASTIGCFLIGCHVDTQNDVISGLSQSEYINAGIMSIGPTPLSVVTPPAVTRALGQAGETGAGIIKNTLRINSETGSAKFRIPDQLLDDKKLLSEVKNVAYQSFTNQLKDFSIYAQKQLYTFELFVRQSTRLSQPLQNAINEGKIVLRYLTSK